MVVAAHAGTGKTWLASRNAGVLDLVCMPHKYLLPCEGVVGAEASKASMEWQMNSRWPDNYVEEIVSAEQSGHWEWILIAPDVRVLFTLRELGIPVLLVYPTLELRGEYHQRYLRRGNSQDFISIFVDGWDYFLKTPEHFPEYDIVWLNAGQFLSDVLV